MVQQHHDRHVIHLSGKRPRLPSYVRSNSRVIERIAEVQHISEEQRAQIAKELQHANEQIELTRQYPGHNQSRVSTLGNGWLAQYSPTSQIRSDD